MTTAERFAHIPAELKALTQWVVWRAIDRGEKKPDGTPKLSKIPFDAKTGAKASSTDPRTWCSYETAVKAAPKYSGIGFVFSQTDPYLGVDLDNCRNAQTGEVEKWAADIVERFRTYAENSVSQTGIHIIVRDCHKPGEKCKKKGVGGHAGADVEIYEQGRYFCFTADPVEGHPEQVNSCQDALNWLYRTLFGDETPAPQQHPKAPVMEASDAELIEIARKSRQGQKFSALWSGDLSGHNNDHSSADMALCQILAFYTGRDADRMDRLFRQSGLMREKWDSKRPGGTYGTVTIQSAIATCTETYKPGHNKPTESRPAQKPKADPPQSLYRLAEVQAAIRAGVAVYLVGSREDADKLIALGLTATVAPFIPRTDKIVNGFAQALRGARVVIIPQNTRPAQNYALQVAQALQGIAAEVRGLIIEKLKPGQGVGDWIEAGGDRAALEKLVAGTRIYQTDVRPSDRELPCINAQEQDYRVICGQIWDAVQAANDPVRYFLYANAPSRLESLFDGRMRLVELTPLKMLAELTIGGPDKRGVADFVLIKTKNGNDYSVPAKLGLDVVNVLLAAPNPPLPPIERLTETPVVARDGSISMAYGYHPSSRSYHMPMPGLMIPSIPDVPNPREVEQAKQLFYELVCDFPFINEADRAHSLALLLLPFVRDLISGPTPIHLIEAPIPGAGKSLLCEALLHPSLGDLAHSPQIGALAEAQDGDEWRKQITTALRKLPIATIADNINRPIDSGHLARAVTSMGWQDRVLGKNEEIEIPIRCAWVITANNPTMSTEIARRSIRIRIDPKADRPWTIAPPGGYRHQDLLGWANEMRGELIRAALLLATNWLAHGRPRPRLKPLGKYENWSFVIGGILEAAGIGGFLANLDDFYDQADQESAKWREFVKLWREEYADGSVGTQELFTIAREMDVFTFRSKDESNQRVSFGRQLGKLRDRVIGNYQILELGVSHGAKQWGLRPTSSADDVEEGVI